MQTMPITDNAVYVRKDVTIFTGKRSLKREELEARGNNLPPDEITKSFGTKAVFDKDKLLPFHAINSRARTLFETYGLKFFDGYLVKEDKFAELDTRLANLRTEFEQELDKLEQTYEQDCEAWVTQFPEWEDVLRAGIVPYGEIRKRFNFGWQAYKIQPVNDEPAQALEACDDKAITAMAKEIADALAQSYDVPDEPCDGITPVSPNTYKPLRRMAARAEALSFTTPVMSHLAAMFGKLESSGRSRADIAQVLKRMSTPKGLTAFCNAIEIMGGVDQADIVARARAENALVVSESDIDMGDDAAGPGGVAPTEQKQDAQAPVSPVILDTGPGSEQGKPDDDDMFMDLSDLF